MTTKMRIHNFFEKPQGFFARLVQFIIFILIIVTVTNVVIEFYYVDIYEKYKALITNVEYVVLAVFTLEYVLRFATAERKLKFAFKPMNLVDFIAVFPTYLEFILPLFMNTTALRGLRLIRMLRFARFLRILRLFKFGKSVRKAFRFQGTILQSIMPVIFLFVVMKSTIWALESYGFWFANASLGELFAIIGFALGIILAQKISTSYDKFLQVEESVIRLYGTLHSLELILNKFKAKLGTKTCKDWGNEFLETLEDIKTDNKRVHAANHELYEVIAKAEIAPAELAILHGDICRDAAFCLSKKVRLTPRAYDTLLEQSTMLYLALIAVFIPGAAGLVSVVVATYILYGMYNLTQDLDSIIGGEFDLINIDISEFKDFIKQ